MVTEQRCRQVRKTSSLLSAFEENGCLELAAGVINLTLNITRLLVPAAQMSTYGNTVRVASLMHNLLEC